MTLIGNLESNWETNLKPKNTIEISGNCNNVISHELRHAFQQITISKISGLHRIKIHFDEESFSIVVKLNVWDRYSSKKDNTELRALYTIGLLNESASSFAQNIIRDLLHHAYQHEIDECIRYGDQIIFNPHKE